LPEPLGPRMAKFCPRASDSETSANTRNGSAGVGYSFTTFSTTSSVICRVGTAHQSPPQVSCTGGQCPPYESPASLRSFVATSSGIGIDTGGPPCTIRQQTLVIFPLATSRPSCVNAKPYVTLFVPTRSTVTSISSTSSQCAGE